MKKKISISMEENTVEKLKSYILDGSFRNTSHVIEVAVNKFMKDENGADN